MHAYAYAYACAIVVCAVGAILVAMMALPPRANALVDAMYSTSGYTTTPSVDGGCGFSLVLKGDGTVWGWGTNNRGQLGDLTTTDRLTPVQVHRAVGGQPLGNIRQISAGCFHALALDANGQVWSWGRNDSNQLGLGSASIESCGGFSCSTGARRVRIDNAPTYLDDVLTIAAMSQNSHAVRGNTVYSWGDNSCGQVGDPTFGGGSSGIARLTKANAAGTTNLTSITDLAAGASHVLARRSDGDVYAWGCDDVGQLGNGAGVTNWTWAQVVPGLANVRSIAARDDQSMALRDGQVYAWGDNLYGQAGNNTSSAGGMHAPVLVEVNEPGPCGGSPPCVLDNVVSISATAQNNAAIRADGLAYSWGSDDSGRLGHGAISGYTCPSTTTPCRRRAYQVVLSDVLQVDGGSSHLIASKVDGTIWAWGSNSSGALGDGTTGGSYPTPVQALFVQEAGFSNYVGGCDFSLGVRTDGTVWSWGANETAGTIYGQLGTGDVTSLRSLEPRQVMISPGVPLNRVKQVAAGCSTGYALRNDGTVWAWGSNVDGQLGAGLATGAGARSPWAVRVETAPGVPLGMIMQVAAGRSHAGAVHANGAAFAWGDNLYGQLSDNTTVDRSRPVSMLWDTAFSGCAGTGPTPASLITSLAFGERHSLLLVASGRVRSAGANGSGQLGIGSGASRCAADRVVDPVEPSGYKEKTRLIAAGAFHSVSFNAGGWVYSWGENSDGQLGNAGMPTDSNLPVLTSNDSIQQGATSERATVLVRAGGAVDVVGRNSFGELGSGSTGASQQSRIALGNNDHGATLSPVLTVSAGSTHLLAQHADGSGWAWGNNDRGGYGNCRSELDNPGSTSYQPTLIACAPVAPTALEQRRADDLTVIGAGQWTSDGGGTNLHLRLTVRDPDPVGQQVWPFVELRTSPAFTGSCGVPSIGPAGTGVYQGTPQVKAYPHLPTTDVLFSIPRTGLTTHTTYYWRACAVSDDDVDGVLEPATDKVGPWTSYAQPSFRVDLTAPTNPTQLDDGTTPGVDWAWSNSTTLARATWSGASDGAGSGLADSDWCVVPASSSTCVGAIASGTQAGTALSAAIPARAQGATIHVCVRSRDAVGLVDAAGYACTNGQVVDSLAPGVPNQTSPAPGATVTLEPFQLQATNVDPGGAAPSTLTFQLCDASDCSSVVDSGSSATGLADGASGSWQLAAAQPDGSYFWRVRAVDAAGNVGGWSAIRAITIDRTSTVSIAVSTIGFSDAARDTTAPFALDFGGLLPGVARTIGPAGSGQATPGSAFEVVVTSATYSTSAYVSAANFTGPAALAASALSWRAYSTADPWTPMTTTAALAGSTPIGGGTIAWDWRVLVPVAQPPGAYSTTVTATVLADP